MFFARDRQSSRSSRGVTGWLTAVAIALAVAACGVTGPSAVGDTLRASSVPAASLARLGEFEAVTTSPAGIDSASALAQARRQDFGRPGEPEVSLVRYVGSGLDLGLSNGQLVWIYHWGSLSEEYGKGFPSVSGQPNETVFVQTDYFLVIDATDGTVLGGVSM